MIEILASVFLVIGTAFVALSSLGLARLPDVYSRLHAVTKASTLGMMGILASSAVVSGWAGHNVTAEVVTVLFVFLTNPVGGHMIARSAYLTGTPLTERSSIDELRRAGEHADVDHDTA